MTKRQSKKPGRGQQITERCNEVIRLVRVKDELHKEACSLSDREGSLVEAQIVARSEKSREVALRLLEELMASNPTQPIISRNSNATLVLYCPPDKLHQNLEALPGRRIEVQGPTPISRITLSASYNGGIHLGVYGWNTRPYHGPWCYIEISVLLQQYKSLKEHRGASTNPLYCFMADHICIFLASELESKFREAEQRVRQARAQVEKELREIQDEFEAKMSAIDLLTLLNTLHQEKPFWCQKYEPPSGVES